MALDPQAAIVRHRVAEKGCSSTVAAKNSMASRFIIILKQNEIYIALIINLL